MVALSFVVTALYTSIVVRRMRSLADGGAREAADQALGLLPVAAHKPRLSANSP
jgi:hypothetical protein